MTDPAIQRSPPYTSAIALGLANPVQKTTEKYAKEGKLSTDGEVDGLVLRRLAS